jgi:hypothetical protein
MRPILMALTALAALAAFTPTSAYADQYKWCAEYGGMEGGGGRNCGFVTLEQCRATISGIGGWCEPNPFYTGPERQSRKQRYRGSDRTNR